MTYYTIAPAVFGSVRANYKRSGSPDPGFRKRHGRQNTGTAPTTARPLLQCRSHVGFRDSSDGAVHHTLARIYTQFPLHPGSFFIPIQGTMWFSRPSILLASVLQATQVAFALYIELPTRSEAALPNLLARAPNATSGLDYNNTEEAYYINITLGGRQFSVLIDTGR